ncbi:MAG: DUF4920 domain-containing protein [Proteobacteria bacterium]|nr:DUF4920 domain-containing protein [Pseudomonadota bacterium]
MRFLMLSVLIACGGAPESTVAEAPAEAPAEAAPEAAPEAAAGDWASFGEGVTEGEVIQLATLLDDPAAYEGKDIRVQGRVTDVCQKAGCWMVLTDDTRHVRVTVKEHGYAVDKQGTGADCIVEGQLRSKAVDAAEVAHFKSESSEGAVIPEEQATEKTWEFVAAGVKMRKDS